ncbi:MAG TPA: penicillin-binding transpeptidase domain-containing protein [Bryobacteraceae bacterium]|nr:penicillin-binding transpeptidase domain-containing protein [Bryobacteraceae bacterium]
MLRREFLSQSGLTANVLLDVLNAIPGCALLYDLRSERMLVTHGPREATEWLAAPGSTVKPLSLWALLRMGRLKPDESFPCPRYLRLAGLQMNCSHPQLPFPVTVTEAIAYSCNCATAHFAARFRGDELERFYESFGFNSQTHLVGRPERTGAVATGLHGDQLKLQALGERGVRITPLELAAAYRHLSRLANDPQFQPILEGMEGAVRVGTGQAAQVTGITVAGKTGTVQTDPGIRAAWFAGFAPSRKPKVVVTVLTQGRSGAEAAAPIAGKLLRQYFAKSRS